MQGLLVVFLLAATAAAIPGNRCPKIQEVNWGIEVLLPHRDCDKFYQCTHGEPVEMSCPKGLFYNIIERLCDWKDRVKCGGRNIPEEDESEVSPAPDSDDSVHTAKPDLPVVDFLENGCPVDPEVHWLLPHEKRCRLFYYCEGGERELRRCPFELHFNKKRQICDWPRDAGCIELREKEDITV